jgi:DUF971 family protein
VRTGVFGGVGVVLARYADIAPLGIENDNQPATGGIAADFFEHSNTPRAKPFKARALGLDDSRVLVHAFDHTHAKIAHARDGLMMPGPYVFGHVFRNRIKPHAHDAGPIRHRPRQTLREVLHAFSVRALQARPTYASLVTEAHDVSLTPTAIDLDKREGLTITWSDGTTSRYTVAHLRRMSPSAEMRELRESLAKNPLTVLPSPKAQPHTLTALSAELVGNYALRIVFSDGHATGIYSWPYLLSLDNTRAGDRKP